MLQKIMRGLHEIEQTRNVTIIYACEAGSRAWGFDSIDSDFDVRFVYVKPRNDYFTAISKNKDTINVLTPVEPILDYAGWDILKALSLAYSSNPSLIEWMGSPIVYKKNFIFDNLMKKYLNKGYAAKSLMHHYGGLATRNWHTYLKNEGTSPIKKYFYSLRPAMCIQYMLEHDYAIPPVSFEQLKNGISLDSALLEETNKLVAYKKGVREMKINELQVPLVREYIQKIMNSYRDAAIEAPSGSMNADELNALGIAFINGIQNRKNSC